MAEWEQSSDGGTFAVEIAGRRLLVYQGRPHCGEGWLVFFDPITGSYRNQLQATTAEAAKLEALTLVGEWVRSLAVEAAELRGRMVDDELNAPATPGEG